MPGVDTEDPTKVRGDEARCLSGIPFERRGRMMRLVKD